MNRRDFLRLSASTAATASITGKTLLPSTTQAVTPLELSTERPNILFLAVDDLRPALGCYGDKLAITPNIDCLAGNGILFNRAYCQSALCNPSRSSLFTGRRPDTTKVWGNRAHFREALPGVLTLPEYFMHHGYHVENIGKMFHGQTYTLDPQSWSVPPRHDLATYNEHYAIPEAGRGKIGASVASPSRPDNAFHDGMVTDDAVNTLQSVKNRQFFLAVGFRRPHLPFSAPKKYWDLYDRKLLSQPDNPRYPIDMPSLAIDGLGISSIWNDIPEGGKLSSEKIAELRHGYYACVSYIDMLIGRLLHELEELGLRDNTIVILWGDHGFHLGEHGIWGKQSNFELDTRSPMMLEVPSQKNRGVNTDALVEFVDIYPTLVDLCGLPIPEGLEGVSMSPLLDDPNRPWKKAAFSQYLRVKEENEYMGYSARTDRYRYTEWQERETGRVAARELYDHENDPGETVNLAPMPEFTKTITRLSNILNRGWEAALPPS